MAPFCNAGPVIPVCQHSHEQVLNKGKTTPFLCVSVCVHTVHSHVITSQCLFQMNTPLSRGGEARAGDANVGSLGLTCGSVLSYVHLGLGSNQDHLAGLWAPALPPNRTCSGALPLLSAPRGGPGWILDVWRPLVPGSLGDGAGEVGVLGWDWRVGGENSCSVRLRHPQSTGACLRVQMGRASGPHHPIWASLPSGPTVRPGRPVLFSE